MKARLSLSVIVLTHNSFRDKGGCIRHTLAALAGQRAEPVSVLVVDNASTPTDRRLLNDCISSSALFARPIKVIHVDTSIGGARNLGASHTQSDLIVFLDDDAILLESSALGHVAHRGYTSSHGYGAQRLWTPHHPWFIEHSQQALTAISTGRTKDFVRHLGGPPFPPGDFPVYWDWSFPGHFGFVHRSLFDAVGGFPEDFIGYGYEDNAFGLQCYLRDPRHGWLGGLRVAHVHHPQPSRTRSEQTDNHRRFEAMLASHGLAWFDIAVLLRGVGDDPTQSVLSPTP